MLLFALASPTGSKPLPIIMLVEDHGDTRQMYAEYLGTSFEILQAASAEAALEMLRVRRPDLIITDLSLPGLDGFGLIERVRADHSLNDIPVICVSGYGGVAHEERARTIGCDRVMQKPCLPDELAEMSHELVRRFRERKRS